MGYVFEFKDARAYDQWFQKRRNQSAISLQCRIMKAMLEPQAGETVLDIGCGIGTSMQSHLNTGLNVTGLDPSPYMLDAAHTNLGDRIDLYRGFAEDLPFDDNSFHYACFFATLEFVNDPQKAIEEACRVAKDKMFIGIFNRYALKGIHRRIKGIFSESFFNHAHFYSVWELKKMVRKAIGEVPVSWRTVCQFPNPAGKIVESIERLELVQRCPFGAFAGMIVTLVPRFRTRPLALRYHPTTTNALAGGQLSTTVTN